MYKDKIENLLSSLEGKLRVIELVATGQMPTITTQELVVMVQDCKKIKERLQDLIDIER
jgi:hypothetical protein